MRNLGPMVKLSIGTVDVLVNGLRTQSFDAGAFTLAGIRVDRCKIIGERAFVSQDCSAAL